MVGAWRRRVARVRCVWYNLYIVIDILAGKPQDAEPQDYSILHARFARASSSLATVNFRALEIERNRNRDTDFCSNFPVVCVSAGSCRKDYKASPRWLASMAYKRQRRRRRPYRTRRLGRWRSQRRPASSPSGASRSCSVQRLREKQPCAPLDRNLASIVDVRIADARAGRGVRGLLSRTRHVDVPRD